MTLVNTVMRFLLCMPSCFSHVQLFETLWTVAHQAPLSMGILQAILEWVAMSSSRGSSQARDQTHVSCTFLQVDCLPTEPPRKSEVSICPYHFYSLSCHLFPSDGKHFPDILSKSVLHILQWLGKISIV